MRDSIFTWKESLTHQVLTAIGFLRTDLKNIKKFITDTVDSIGFLNKIRLHWLFFSNFIIELAAALRWGNVAFPNLITRTASLSSVGFYVVRFACFCALYGMSEKAPDGLFETLWNDLIWAPVNLITGSDWLLTFAGLQSWIPTLAPLALPITFVALLLVDTSISAIALFKELNAHPGSAVGFKEQREVTLTNLNNKFNLDETELQAAHDGITYHLKANFIANLTLMGAIGVTMVAPALGWGIGVIGIVAVFKTGEEAGRYTHIFETTTTKLQNSINTGTMEGNCSPVVLPKAPQLTNHYKLRQQTCGSTHSLGSQATLARSGSPISEPLLRSESPIARP